MFFLYLQPSSARCTSVSTAASAHCVGNINPSGADLSTVWGARPNVELMLRCGVVGPVPICTQSQYLTIALRTGVFVCVCACVRVFACVCVRVFASVCRVNDSVFAVFSGWSNNPAGLGFVASYLTQRLTISAT
jgi:hypothetical protein